VKILSVTIFFSFFNQLLIYIEVVILLSSTFEHDGVKKNMAVTQFAPADARRCFPCWDEPACKVLQSLSLSLSFSLFMFQMNASKSLFGPSFMALRVAGYIQNYIECAI
jgi:hypothetical protein